MLKSIGTKFRSYIEYHKRFSVVEDLSLLQIHKRLNKSIKNQKNIIYGIPFSDRQLNRMNQLESRSFSIALCKLLAKQLDGIIICSEIII